MPNYYDYDLDFDFKGKLGHVERNVLHRIEFKRPIKLPEMKIDENFTTFKLTETIATQMADKVDAEIYELMYQAYKDTDCNQVIILDKTEFKNFVNMFLPEYIKLIRKDSKSEGND